MRLAWIAGLRPAFVFAALSLFFGTWIIAATPPLRGPDETAHFVRAYGISLGEVLPSDVDVAGRKGIQIPERIYSGFSHFEAARVGEKKPGFTYGPAFLDYFNRDERPAQTSPGTFVLYEGSEGYSPVAYLPHAVAAFLARIAGLDFLTTQYLMRMFGLAAFTAVIAYAIALAGPLGWAFLAIAMLPSALYGRAVINADGAALALAMIAATFCLRALPGRPVARAAWMFLCALSKPPNLAFVLIELLRPPLRRLSRSHLAAIVIVVAPAIIGAVAWTMASSADVAAWRLTEFTGNAPEEFDPAAKLLFMLAHPSDFPTDVFAMMQEKHGGEFWRQLIGVLGLFDTVLQPWSYAAITLLALIPWLVPLADTADRWRATCAAGLTALGYVVTVCLIFYLVWTPLEAATVWGGQGRYFVPVLPLVAIVVAALVRRALDERVIAVSAMSSATLSGVASLEAILRTDWGFA